MKTRDLNQSAELAARLATHSALRRRLPGINHEGRREAFLRQLIDSIHRVRFPTVLATRDISSRRADPNDAEYFDPIRAAVFFQREDRIDEAIWLVFLFVHFGKHPRGGWRYLRDVYGRLGEGTRWDWASASTDVRGFLAWLAQNEMRIRTSGGAGGFGNHRKRESLSPEGTGRAVATYVEWVGPSHRHSDLFEGATRTVGGDRFATFGRLYDSMNAVWRFGRTARFDYLTMLGKLGLAIIAPDSTHLTDATGPLTGARILFGVDNHVSPATLEAWLRDLDRDLDVGPQVLEDAICNWQKAPDCYRAFRG